MKTKNKNTDLNVDFIQSKPLTKEEEIELSLYIKKLKKENNKTSNKAA